MEYTGSCSPTSKHFWGKEGPISNPEPWKLGQEDENTESNSAEENDLLTIRPDNALERPYLKLGDKGFKNVF